MSGEVVESSEGQVNLLYRRFVMPQIPPVSKCGGKTQGSQKSWVCGISARFD